ncbi:unnamed protein product, partial [marine sediment metagenome]
DIARLHIEGIKTGFISSLGIGFVTALYEAIAENKSSFGIVAEENDKVLGFIAFTTNLNKLYKSVVTKSGIKFAFLLAGKIFSLKTIKKVFETLFYPNRIKKLDLPSAELLSVVVAKDAQGKGLGAKLVQKGLAACAKRGIDKVKVLVGAENEPANRLYLKCGFELVGQIENHGVLSDVYVAGQILQRNILNEQH